MTNVRDMEFDGYTRNVLIRSGINYLEQIPTDVKALLKFRGIGKITAEKIIKGVKNNENN